MNDWNRLEARLSKPDFATFKLLVGLDFDGTLAEIAPTPREAALSAETRGLLRGLARRRDTKLAVLSGRALTDVKSKVGIRGIYYGGNHGLEIEGPRIRWTHPHARTVDAALRRDLEAALDGFSGALLEDKRMGLALHYRRVSPRRVGRLKQRLQSKLAGLGDSFRIHAIKKAYEIRPNVPWDKGHALETIRKTLPGGWMALFVGDDATDEEGFRTLGRQALTIRVGRLETSAAQYVIPRRALVDRLLALLAKRSRRA